MAFAGVLVHSLRGPKGKISVPGLGAVVGELHSWQLIRREDGGRGNPVWDLHAVFRYQNDPLLKNESLKKKIHLVLGGNQREKTIDICGWQEFEVEENRLVAKGVTQCPTT